MIGRGSILRPSLRHRQGDHTAIGPHGLSRFIAMGAPGGRHQNMLSNGVEQRPHQGNAINTPIAERLQHRLQVEISRFTVNIEVGRGIKKRAGGYVQRVAQAQ